MWHMTANRIVGCMRGNPDVIPQNCPFAWEDLGPILYVVPRVHPSQHPERHHDRTTAVVNYYYYLLLLP